MLLFLPLNPSTSNSNYYIVSTSFFSIRPLCFLIRESVSVRSLGLRSRSRYPMYIVADVAVVPAAQSIYFSTSTRSLTFLFRDLFPVFPRRRCRHHYHNSLFLPSEHRCHHCLLLLFRQRRQRCFLLLLTSASST